LMPGDQSGALDLLDDSGDVRRRSKMLESHVLHRLEGGLSMSGESTPRRNEAPLKLIYLATPEIPGLADFDPVALFPGFDNHRVSVDSQEFSRFPGVHVGSN